MVKEMYLAKLQCGPHRQVEATKNVSFNIKVRLFIYKPTITTNENVNSCKENQHV